MINDESNHLLVMIPFGTCFFLRGIDSNLMIHVSLLIALLDNPLLVGFLYKGGFFKGRGQLGNPKDSYWEI